MSASTATALVTEESANSLLALRLEAPLSASGVRPSKTALFPEFGQAKQHVDGPGHVLQ